MGERCSPWWPRRCHPLLLKELCRFFKGSFFCEIQSGIFTITVKYTVCEAVFAASLLPHPSRSSRFHRDPFLFRFNVRFQEFTVMTDFHEALCLGLCQGKVHYILEFIWSKTFRSFISIFFPFFQNRTVGLFFFRIFQFQSDLVKGDYWALVDIWALLSARIIYFGLVTMETLYILSQQLYLYRRTPGSHVIHGIRGETSDPSPFQSSF